MFNSVSKKDESSKGFYNAVEKIGNKIPNPMIFSCGSAF